MSDVLNIGEDFPTPTLEQWRAIVEPDLKGAPFEKKLVTRLIEGISIQPLYTEADLPGTDPSGFPGQPPYVRGAKASAQLASGWQIVQEHRLAVPEQANRAILSDLERGVQGVHLRLSARLADDKACGAGVLVDNLDDLDRTLSGVDLSKTLVSLQAGSAALPAAALLVALWKRRGVAATAAKASFNADPIGTFASQGSAPRGIEAAVQEAAELAVVTSASYPQATALVVNTAAYDGAGATAVQELAATLSTAVAYLRALEGAGLSPTAAAKQLVFMLSVGCDQFLDIAKLRALRLVVARLLEAAGVSTADAKTIVHARTSQRVLTRRDPWVNMLRTTLGCFASAVGGADRVTVQPFDSAIGPSDDLARRVARNTQIVLQEEGNLSRVIDPAGGCYYVESLTRELATRAWTEFQGIEARGGIVAVLKDGSLLASITAVADSRAKDLAKRKIPITGVSEYANLKEKAPERPTASTSSVEERLAARRAAPTSSPDLTAARSATGSARFDSLVAAAASGALLGELASVLPGSEQTVSAFKVRRLAEGFEGLRDASDAALAKTGKRPSIFLANMGPIALHTGRAMFSQNFFEAGGIEALTNEGFANADAAAAAYKASGTNLAIICSSDAWYDTGAEETARALKAAGAHQVILAGSPGENEGRYRAAGVDRFIFMGCDVLATLTELAKLEGALS